VNYIQNRITMAPARKSTSNPTSTKSFAQLTKPQLLSLAAVLGIDVDAQQTVPIIRTALRPAVEQAQNDGVSHAGFERIFPPRTGRQATPAGDEDDDEEDEGEEWGGIATQLERGRSDTHGAVVNPNESVSRRHPPSRSGRRATSLSSTRGVRAQSALRRPFSRIIRFAEPGSLAARAREQETQGSMSRDASHRQSLGNEQGENLIPIMSEVEQIGHRQLSDRPSAGRIRF
jgi:hypothetical protein